MGGKKARGRTERAKRAAAARPSPPIGLFKTGSIVHKKNAGTWYRGEIIEVDEGDLDLPYFVLYDDGDEEDMSHEVAVEWVTQLGEGHVSVANKGNAEKMLQRGKTRTRELQTAEAAAAEAAAAEPFKPLPPTQQATNSQPSPPIGLFKTGSIVHKKNAGTWYRGEIIEVDEGDLDLPYLVLYDDGDEEDMSHEVAVEWVTQLGEGHVSVFQGKRREDVATRQNPNS
jgi:hypothetical protein